MALKFQKGPKALRLLSKGQNIRRTGRWAINIPLKGAMNIVSRNISLRQAAHPKTMPYLVHIQLCAETGAAFGDDLARTGDIRMLSTADERTLLLITWLTTQTVSLCS